MKSTVITFVVTLLVAVAGTAGFFLAKPDPMAPVVKQLQAEVLKAREETGRIKIERDNLAAELKKAAAAPPKIASLAGTDPAAAPLPPGSKPGDAKTGPKPAAGTFVPAGGSEALRKLMSDPGMRDMMHRQQESMVDRSYGKLFQKLNLNEQEQANFRQLLVNRANLMTDAGLKMGETPEQRKATMAEIATRQKEADASIHKFLNNEDDYKTYQQWEDTKTERSQLQRGEAAFDLAGDPLTDEQREQLLAAMAAARKAPGLPKTTTASDFIPGGGITPEGIEHMLQRQDNQAVKVLETAAAFLTPLQMEALKRMQQQLRTSTEDGFKLTNQMIGGRK